MPSQCAVQDTTGFKPISTLLHKIHLVLDSIIDLREMLLVEIYVRCLIRMRGHIFRDIDIVVKVEFCPSAYKLQAKSISKSGWWCKRWQTSASSERTDKQRTELEKNRSGSYNRQEQGSLQNGSIAGNNGRGKICWAKINKNYVKRQW